MVHEKRKGTVRYGHSDKFGRNTVLETSRKERIKLLADCEKTRSVVTVNDRGRDRSKNNLHRDSARITNQLCSGNHEQK